MKFSPTTSVFFSAPTGAAQNNSAEPATLPNEVELEKVLQKSAFKEAKKQWKVLINKLEQA